MTSIDELFRKRKLDDPTATFSRSSNNKTNADEDLDALEAGPALPPPDDGADEQEEGDDAEGRFFESGISARERSALNLLAHDDGAAEAEAEEHIDLAWLKKTALSFERKINKNAELRAKFELEPLKFIGSEADLDAEIRNLSLLAEHGELYADFVRSGCVASLVGLLAHENSDIAVSACQVLAELTDDDTGVDDAQWKVLADALIKADVVDLLQWLVTRIKRPDASARGQVGQNRLYAAEVLAILVHRSARSRHSLAAHTDAVDSILQVLAPYRTHEPEERNSDEAEFVQNLFDTLACLVQDDLGARQFIDSEGIELCLLMLRRHRGGRKTRSTNSISQSRAVQVLDHAMTASTSSTSSATTVDVYEKDNKETVEHVVGILASLLRSTPAGSAARIRTLAKFVEDNHAKIDRLLRLRAVYRQRIHKEQEEQQEDNDREQEWLSIRLDAGLFVLNTLDVVLSWLVAEDDVARDKIRLALEQDERLPPGTGLTVLHKSLRDQLKGMDHQDSSHTDARDILQALLNCL
ncbi:hypothetical protein DV736_g5838, partial [Chaetothyriales sp. CBS 134916]